MIFSPVIRSSVFPASCRLSVAPMLDWTDRHCRFFLRQISRGVGLYTEMITTGALLHGDPERHLDFSPEEHPLALQLGGSDPAELAACARMASDWGYSEINLNVGCPSGRVQNGRFGACLMAEPGLVAECVAAMREVSPLPVTVKHRLGIDQLDSDEALRNFVSTVAMAGCDGFIVHARKAWLKGLNPRENREIPPLQYQRVHQLKMDFPDLRILLNGGVETLDAAEQALDWADGVMMGRAAYHNPWLLAEADRRIFGHRGGKVDRGQVVRGMYEYLERMGSRGVRVNHVTRHMLGLYHGQPGARRWRRLLGEGACAADAKPELLLRALAEMEELAQEHKGCAGANSPARPQVAGPAP